MVKRSNPDQFQLRLPPGMRDRLKQAAESSNRSMNAEIVERLEDSFDFPNREARLNAKIAELGREIEGVYQEVADLEEEIGRREKAKIENLAEIRMLRIGRQEFDQELAKRQSEIDALREELSEVRQILGNYLAHSERLQTIEEQLRLLGERLPMQSRRKDHE